MASKTIVWSQLGHKSDEIQENSEQFEGNVSNCLNNKMNEKFVSLDEVMSEQLAIKLNEEDLSFGQDKTAISGAENNDYKEIDDELIDMLSNEYIDCSSDELLAHQLQYEFDLEHDQNLKKEKNKQNANSKVSISFDYDRLLQYELAQSDSEDDYDNYGEESKPWDSFEKSQKQEVKIGRQGFAVKNGVMTTKHDLKTSAQRNACKLMEFGSGLETGDGGGFDMKLNNNVYNALKVHRINEQKRMERVHDKKEKATAEKVMDEKSRILVFKLINQGILDAVYGVISTGKESFILHGHGSYPEKGITNCEVAIKLFKTTLNEFRNRSQYICNDPKLHQSSRLSKQNPKIIIPLWAEKEMHNLNRIRRNGIPCPQVLTLKKHILVMTFIGKDGKSAPTLRDATLTSEQLSDAWTQTKEMMIKMFRDCDLIHADFSEYNLLWYQNKVWCIDVSQAVLTTHSMAYKFLWRDCNNIHNFFSKRCLPEVMSPRDLFTTVCGKQLNSDSNEDDFNCVDLLDKIDNFERNEELLTHGIIDNDSFDEMFEKSLRAKHESGLLSVSHELTAN